MKIKESFQKFTNLKLLPVALIIFAISGAMFMQRSSAATGLYLSGSTSVAKGSTLTITVKLNTTTLVDGVETYLTYNQSRLQFISIDGTTSAFPIGLMENGGNGGVTIVRGKLEGRVSGDLVVAKVTFKALSSTNTASVGLSGNATSWGAYTNPGARGMSIKFTGSKKK